MEVFFFQVGLVLAVDVQLESLHSFLLNGFKNTGTMKISPVKMNCVPFVLCLKGRHCEATSFV